MKKIIESNQWSKVSEELEQEVIKRETYDKTLLFLIGDVKNKTIFDYGCGPGVLASELCSIGAGIKAFDKDEDMRKKCGEKIGYENIYNNTDEIPSNYFDITICNLVMCLKEEPEVRNIAAKLRNSLKDRGIAYIGFCNPVIYDVPESALDHRRQTEYSYDENHKYKKIKKEGNYEITEKHRPIYWYLMEFQKQKIANLKQFIY